MTEATEAQIEAGARAAYDRAFLKHAPEDVDRWDDLVLDGHEAVESWREVARAVLSAALKVETPEPEKPAGWARCNPSAFHSKSSAYAVGYQTGWADRVMNRNVVTERPNEQKRRLKEETDD